LRGPEPGQTADPWTSVRQLEERQSALERDLVRQIPELAIEERLAAATHAAVAMELPPRSTLIEFVRFNVFDFDRLAAGEGASFTDARYAAFVLASGRPDGIDLIDLGEAESIDALVATFRRMMSAGYGRGTAGAAAATAPERIEAALRARVLDPIVGGSAHLQRLMFAADDSAHVIVAPDGELTQLPFEVLLFAGGRRLLDRCRVSYLNSGREIINWRQRPARDSRAPIVAGDPRFALDARQSTPFGTAADADDHRHSRDVHGLVKLRQLPGTREEAAAVAAMLRVEPWIDEAVLEARLKAHRSPRILHLATHGLFLENQAKASRASEPFARLISDATPLASGVENPMLRSMLCLAGAQTFLDGGALPPEAEDGLLTAEDVAGLDLLDTELVVLSACDTGRGEVKVGEGVFGLRRAFAIAGARTLVMSLWKVPDEATRMLMVRFYEELQAGRPRVDALRAAQQTVRDRYPDPYYWGAFILQGDALSPLLLLPSSSN
jgi:CHAT domain-containing protein